jgi:hypothetical protein
MDESTRRHVNELKRLLLQRHPEWSEEKRAWLAMQGAGLIPGR